MVVSDMSKGVHTLAAGVVGSDAESSARAVLRPGQPYMLIVIFCRTDPLFCATPDGPKT